MDTPKCPKCGSKRLVRIDELNPDYNCLDCGALIIGLADSRR
jgi:DNA-directed RNA polymerase subunit RPC12/RpoP